MYSLYNKNILYFLFCIAVIVFCSQVRATETIAKAIDSSQALLSSDSGEKKWKYIYQLDDRPDPFTPFVTKIVKQKVRKDEIVEEEIELTGMQVFEPGQLTLVALMRTGDRVVGMVQDVSGQGYVLSTGMLIGRRGVITGIDEEKIVILETATTRAGRKVKNEIILTLNKEGD